MASYEKMMDAFKCNRTSDATAMFGTLKLERYHDMGWSSYRLLISWLCRKEKLVGAHYGDMLKRRIGADNEVFASLGGGR